MDRLLQTFLIVIGLSSPIEKVVLFSPVVVVRDNMLAVSISASNVLNEELYELIESGIPVDIIGVLMVRSKNRIIFNRVVFAAKIRKGSEGFVLNDEHVFELAELGETFKLLRFLVPLDIERLSGKKLDMRFELKLYSSVFSGVRDLWGNSPHIDFSFSVP